MIFRDATNQFRSAMLDAGIEYHGQLIPDGKLHRIHIEGHRSGTQNGAYILHLGPHPAGWGCNWKSGATFTWSAKSRDSQPLKIDWVAIEREKQERQDEQEKRWTDAARKARYIWSRSTEAIQYSYLTRKQIEPHGARIGRNNLLLIPLYNAQLELVNLQFISPAGEKRFLSGGRKKGCFLIVRNNHDAITNPILICEGYATGASLHEETGHIVVVAFDAGNLLPVAKVFRKRLRDAEIVICADNDASGVGQSKARKAAVEIGAKVAIPPIEGFDFNDFINFEKNQNQVCATAKVANSAKVFAGVSG